MLLLLSCCGCLNKKKIKLLTNLEWETVLLRKGHIIESLINRDTLFMTQITKDRKIYIK